MNNKKGTKRALFTSLLMLLLSCSMFVGSTYAWFTDSVVSRNNVITSGNLDVEMEYSTDGETWTPVTEETSIFTENALWEPGYTQVVALRVKNEGSLTLKYALSTKIYLEESGINVNGKEFNLSDYLVLDGITMSGDAMGDALVGYYLGSRDASGLYRNEFDSQIKNDPYVSDSVLKPEEYGYCVLRISMPTTVGNEANHNGINAPKISFGIELLATQAMEEKDSFGPDYDKDAEYEIAPVANVGVLALNGPISATLGMGGSVTEFELDKAFRFETTETADEAAAGDYKDWHADFVVSANKDVEANSIVLAGYYKAYCDEYNNGNWVALVNDGMPVAAGEEIRLLELMLNGGSMSYEELCNWVPTFDCGLAEYNSADLSGTTITVELRLFEVKDSAASTAAETGHYITAGTYSYTFE